MYKNSEKKINRYIRIKNCTGIDRGAYVSQRLKREMTVFDIVCGLLLAVGAWKGWRDGIIVQLSGILGLLVGVYLAYRYSIPASRWLGSEGMTGQAAGFLIVFGLVLVALALLGRLMRGLFKFAGLGLFDQLGAPRSGL